MLRSRRGRRHLTIAAGLFAAGARALALDASDVVVYRFGPVHVRPRVTVSGRYEDNIFFQGNNSLAGVTAQDDFITTVSPSLNFQLGRLQGNHIQVSYEMDQSLYARNNAQDHRDHLFSLNTRLQG